MKDKLVSVNLTTYNRANLLPRCLDSILSQTYRELEIVVVDDGSVDNTEDLVAEYIKKDSRVKYIKHDENQGNAFARNTGLKECRGIYIAFMDDDDEWIDKDKIKKQVKIFEDNKDTKIAIVCSSVNLVAENNEVKEKIINKPKDLLYHILIRNGVIYSPTVLTKRDVLERVGGFDTRLPRGIDSDFYRNCIVKYKYDVFFMSDVTTNIYEFGDDRMTPTDSFSALVKSSLSTFYTIKKYFFYFFIHPVAMLRRIKSLLSIYIEYIWKKN